MGTEYNSALSVYKRIYCIFERSGSVGTEYYGLTASAGVSYAKSSYNNFTISITVSGGLGTPGRGGNLMYSNTKRN